MKIIFILIVCILILGCSTMPEDYEYSDNEIKVLEYGVFWGAIMTGLIVYTDYYLDEKAEWY